LRKEICHRQMTESRRQSSPPGFIGANDIRDRQNRLSASQRCLDEREKERERERGGGESIDSSDNPNQIRLVRFISNNNTEVLLVFLISDEGRIFSRAKSQLWAFRSEGFRFAERNIAWHEKPLLTSARKSRATVVVENRLRWIGRGNRIMASSPGRHYSRYFTVARGH
jgi:hypothetical protein